MGGTAVPGIGWAAGLERLAILLDDKLIPEQPRPVALITIANAATEQSHQFGTVTGHALKIANHLRSNGIPVYYAYDNSTPKQFKKANKVNAFMAVIVGEDEIANNRVSVKNLDTGVQQLVPLNELLSHCKSFL